MSPSTLNNCLKSAQLPFNNKPNANNQILLIHKLGVVPDLMSFQLETHKVKNTQLACVKTLKLLHIKLNYKDIPHLKAEQI